MFQQMQAMAQKQVNTHKPILLLPNLLFTYNIIFLLSSIKYYGLTIHIVCIIRDYLT